jgi:biopolymer transport protein ExbD
MARRRRKSRYSMFSEDEGLNLTPLLDVIFNLIFFFVLATTIRTEESFFELILPTASEAAPQKIEERVPEVQLARDGTLFLNGKPLTEAQLLDELTKLVKEKKSSKAIVSADAEALVQQSVDVMNLLRKAGITEMTQRVRSGPAPKP